MDIVSLFIQTLIGGIGIGSLYALVALGYSMIYRSMGLVNFAHGQIYMVGTYFGILWYRGMVMGIQVPYPLAFVIGVLLTAAFGLVLERIFRPLANLDLMLMLLGTIGLGYVLDNVAVIAWGAEGFAVKAPLPNTPIMIGGVALLPQMLLLIGVSAVLMVGLNVFLSKAKIGKAMRAAAQDRETASAMGIPVNTTNALVFAIGAGLAAAAGILAAPIVYVSPSMGAAVGLKGFAAFILGGAGSIPGAIVGGLVFGVLEAISAGFISSAYVKGIAFVVMILVLMVKPAGIVGEVTVDKV
ncbi:High-affinity branched-chain amino acid transport system permease protein LivH [Anaerolineae bacterium]|nr:High-affinity branched-chain amino acid transport system permease protein LivH [Anaerolineae bacterium]